MMKNNTLNEIGQVLANAGSILIFPHVNMDGDAIGSAIALCQALRDMGKESHILIEDPIPDNLKFIAKDYCTYKQNIIENADVSVCVDCGDAGRFAKRKDKFDQSPVTVCIDHHVTTEPYCQYNYIDGKSAATAQLIYKLLRTMEAPITTQIAEPIYTGIATDTGNFRYSNTTAETHLIVADLYKCGIDAAKISVELFESVSEGKMRIRNKALNDMEIMGEGRGAIVCVTQKMLAETGAKMDETDGIIPELRSISGVEIAAVLKEYSDNVTKVSLRAKYSGNVADIAAQLGGGGHVKAAGCTINAPIKDAYNIIREKIVEELKRI